MSASPESRHAISPRHRGAFVPLPTSSARWRLQRR